MIGVELVAPGTKTPAPSVAGAVLEETRRRGLLIGKGGRYGNVLRIAPPLSVSASEAAQALGILEAALRAAEAP
jgi:4-aminobutyrate aminotransferase